MTNPIFLRLKGFAWAATLLLVCGASAALADQTKNEDTSCDGSPLTAAERQYQPQPGDMADAHHLEIARPFTGSGVLEVSVCNARLRVLTRPDAKSLKLSVDLGDKAPGPAADYVHIFRIEPGHSVIHLKFSSDSHAVVTLTLPMSSDLQSEFNLGKGELNFDAIGSAGKRAINVGYGHAKLLLDGDKSYSSMEVNIGMGSLHDHRPGGRDGHFVVSRNYSGTGDGSLEVNVGMGSLDIAQE